MLTQADTHTLLLTSARARRREGLGGASQADQPRHDLLESEKPDIGREAFPLHNGEGTIVVASVWLVLYVIATIQPFIASFLQELR